METWKRIVRILIFAVKLGIPVDRLGYMIVTGHSGSACKNARP